MKKLLTDSQKLRFELRLLHEESGYAMPFEEFYHSRMNQFRSSVQQERSQLLFDRIIDGGEPDADQV